jgi:hypothetical protein
VIQIESTRIEHAADKRHAIAPATAHTLRFDTVPAGRGNASLLLQIARLELMPNGKNEHDVIGRQPSVFRNVGMAAAREHELGQPVERRSVPM